MKDNYVILDDDADMLDEQLKHLGQQLCKSNKNKIKQKTTVAAATVVFRFQLKSRFL